MLALFLLFAIFRALHGAPVTSPDNSIFQDEEVTYLNIRTLTFGHRETSNIIVSCLATIFACTWTAIHPNISGPTDSGWVCLKRRVLTTTYALLAPEIIVLWALRQRIAARRIAEMYNRDVALLTEPLASLSFLESLQEALGEWLYGRPLPVSLKRGEVRSWTEAHGFFIQMGGFMLSEGGRPIQVLPYSHATDSSKIKHAQGIKEFIKKSVIDPPMTTEAEIKDRSKGNFISKTVIILQTSWFVAQCIARWSTKLPVTELEVVTLGFALLNGITYFLWWNKPQGVEVPVYLEKKIVDHRGEKATEAQIQDGTSDDEKNVDDVGPVTLTHDAALASPGDSTRRSYLRRRLRMEREETSPWIFWTWDIPYIITLALLRPLDKMWKSSKIAEGALRVPMFHTAALDDPDDFIADAISTFVAVLFGSVHLIPAWFLRFPSITEKWLWRISAIIITAEPIILLIVYQRDNLKLPKIILNLIIILFGLPALLGALLYILSRFTLIVLAFFSLRALPSGAHSTIDWIPSVPHF